MSAPFQLPVEPATSSKSLAPAGSQSNPRRLSGIYVHWPFCARKCPYCDFYTFGREHSNFALHERFVDALLSEIDSLAGRLPFGEKPEADTIYFGGGTPSLIEPEQLERILAALHAQFKIAPGAEITLEVNPTAAESKRLAPARQLGVNRLSIGCQSFQDRLLKTLGRDHDASTARAVLRLVREEGFENISLDLMFGLPGQTLSDFHADLDEALAFEPEHLSAYGLTLHEGTPFHRWHREKKWKLPGQEIEAAQFELLLDTLAERGFEHYEISNWSRPWLASRHNSKYWAQRDIFAFGPSAHGVLEGRRYANPRDLKDYMCASRTLWFPEERAATSRSAAGEILMLALRRTLGVDWNEIEDWIASWVPALDRPIREYYASELDALRSEGLVEPSGHVLRLTRRGILHADSVMERFF